MTIQQSNSPLVHGGAIGEPAASPIFHELKSILRPLDLIGLFGKSQPMEVELGSGDGSFLVNWARRHPEGGFIGVERLLGRVRKTERRARRAEVNNIRLVRIESSYFLKYLLPPKSIQALHIYFPDPWPKRKHRKNRLINADFPRLAQTVLTPNGKVYLRTDDADYFAQMLEVFRGCHIFRKVETPPELATELTDFEREFQARGISTLRAAYELV